MYDEEESLSFEEIVDTLIALMDEEESPNCIRWEYAFESITERGSAFKRNSPIQ